MIFLCCVCQRSGCGQSYILEKFQTQGINSITSQEAETFFRIDDYVLGEARKQRLSRIINTFGEDGNFGKAVKKIAKKVRDK